MTDSKARRHLTTAQLFSLMTGRKLAEVIWTFDRLNDLVNNEQIHPEVARQMVIDELPNAPWEPRH